MASPLGPGTVPSKIGDVSEGRRQQLPCCHKMFLERSASTSEVARKELVLNDGRDLGGGAGEQRRGWKRVWSQQRLRQVEPPCEVGTSLYKRLKPEEIKSLGQGLDLESVGNQIQVF